MAIGTITGEDGLYKNSDHPRMRDFIYTFSLPNGKMIKSSSHIFTLDKKTWKKPNYPVTAEISYLPYRPEINWIKSDLSDNLGDFFYRNLVFGVSFIFTVYMIAMIVFRISILQYREEKRIIKLVKQGRTLVQLPVKQSN